MKKIELQTMQWSRLRDLRGVEPLNDADAACLAELREVLRHHGALERFALHLAHKHFELAAHEVLVEYSDAQRREHRLHVEPRAQPGRGELIATTWLLGEGTPLVTCMCALRGALGHLGRHESG